MHGRDKYAWESISPVELGSSDEITGLVLRMARLCFTCSLKCGESHSHCVDQFSTDRAEYNRVLYFCAHSEDICEQMAELCSCRVPPPPHVAETCARSCEECADECERLEDGELNELARTCRETAAACREVAAACSSRTGASSLQTTKDNRG
jgi:hypothetical protein